MVSVFPEPAPAITTAGSGGDSMTAACSSVGSGRPNNPLSSRADTRVAVTLALTM
jgi:hypothetical protein